MTGTDLRALNGLSHILFKATVLVGTTISPQMNKLTQKMFTKRPSVTQLQSSYNVQVWKKHLRWPNKIVLFCR